MIVAALVGVVVIGGIRRIGEIRHRGTLWAFGYSFSRNARGTFGPPSFSEAAVEMPAGGGTTRTATTLAY